jgi:small subunit ribosomal protein S1
MDQTNAPTGQEEVPAEETNAKDTDERPATSMGSMETLLQEEGLNLDFPKQGEIRTGVIASIGDNEILVSVGTKSEGVISGKEKEQIPPEILATMQIGQEIPVYVLNPEDPSGNLVLSYNRAREETDWLEAESMKASGTPYEGKVIGYNKGGLIVPIGMLRGFVPASQVSVMRRVEGDESPDARWSKMVDEPIKVVVIEVDRARHRLILSERTALQETRETIKDRLLDELQEGAIKTGRVTSLADFGAFVNVDGADGLVHLSEISWERIDHPSEVLKVGQEVKVKVIAVDQERKRIGLSIRQLLPDPWVVKVSNLKEGQLVEGTITHLTKFGAFARLDEDLEGLIHISELSDQRINHPKEVVKEGDVVTLRVIKLDTERRRIGLSLRKVDSMAYANMDYEMMLSGQPKATPAEEVTEEAAKEVADEVAEEVAKGVAEEVAEEVADEAAANQAAENLPVEEPPPAELSVEPVVAKDDTTNLEESDKFKSSLEYIEGIGPAYADKLNAIGIYNLLDLLEKGCDPKGREEIAEAAGIGHDLVLKWVNHVDLFRIKGVGSEYADLLEVAGVDTVVELATRNPENLYAALESVNEEKKLVRKLPVPDQVQDWIEQAKGLPRKINY